MSPDTSSPAGAVTTGAATRERILAVADELFYGQGIRATSADRIIEEVGITKVTFYRHFRTKADLVVAYLERQSAAEQGWISSTRTVGDPFGSLRTLAEGIGAASCRAGFRGCAFINAAAEFPDGDGEVRTVVDAHRAWIFDTLTEIASEAGARDAESTGRQLVLLRDGAMVGGYLTDTQDLAAWLAAAFESVLTAATELPVR